MLQYSRIVTSVFQRAAMTQNKDESVPPRWMWFRRDKLDEWFKSIRDGESERKS